MVLGNLDIEEKHLQFADDTIVSWFEDANRRQNENLKMILDWFELFSCLKINNCN